MFCRIYCIVCCLLTAIGVQGQDSVLRKGKLVFDPTQKVILATASCGLCQLGLGGDDCRLAVRIKGRAYYVEGAGIDDFGDAHANDGFCNAVRKVQVQGSVVNNRFRLSWLKLLPTPTSKRKATRAQQQRQ